MTAIIAAAGKGSRLGGELPKCLYHVNGKPIFMYQLKALERFEEIRMVVGYKADEVIQQVSAVQSNVVFIKNDDYENTTTLQSFYLGCQGLSEMALFLDGDLILSSMSAKKVYEECLEMREFICVATDISEDPVYAGIENGSLIWFDYNRPSAHEWANVAFIDCNRLENSPTYFFVQLEKFLPLSALCIERLEIDTPNDLSHAEKVLKSSFSFC